MKNRKGFAAVDLSTIAPLVPINKDALSSLSTGEEYEFVPTPGMVHQRTPPPWRLSTDHELNHPDWVELFGEVIGRLTVVGIFAAPTLHMKWVVKCACGAYETRRAQYIKACLDGRNPGEDEPMCAWCTRTNSLRLGYKPKKRPQW